jgi:hypothetical protein
MNSDADDLHILAASVVALYPGVHLLPGVEEEVPLHVLSFDASAAASVGDVELDNGVHVLSLLSQVLESV